jgi:protease I
MSAELEGKRIAFLVAPEGVEEVELTKPWEAVQQAGGTPVLVSTEVGKVQAFNHLTAADTFEADEAADRVKSSDFDALVLPGGVANPDILRRHESAVNFVRGFFDEAGRWR